MWSHLAVKSTEWFCLQNILTWCHPTGEAERELLLLMVHYAEVLAPLHRQRAGLVTAHRVILAVKTSVNGRQYGGPVVTNLCAEIRREGWHFSVCCSHTHEVDDTQYGPRKAM
jgi:hypothetical protein